MTESFVESEMIAVMLMIIVNGQFKSDEDRVIKHGCDDKSWENSLPWQIFVHDFATVMKLPVTEPTKDNIPDTRIAVLLWLWHVYRSPWLQLLMFYGWADTAPKRVGNNWHLTRLMFYILW